MSSSSDDESVVSRPAPPSATRMVAELEHLAHRFAQVVLDLKHDDEAKQEVRAPEHSTNEFDETLLEVQALPADVVAAVQKVWQLCGGVKAPRKRTCKGLFSSIVAHPSESELTAADMAFAQRLSFVTRRYFKSVRALERTLTDDAYSEFHRVRRPEDVLVRNQQPHWKAPLARFLGSDAEGSDDEVPHFMKVTLLRTGAVKKPSLPLRTAPEESGDSPAPKIQPVEKAGSGAASAPGSATKRSRALGSRTLQSLPSLQSIRPALPRNKPAAAVVRPRLAIENQQLDLSDAATRAVCLRHDVHLSEAALDARLVALRLAIVATLDSTRQLGEMLRCHRALEQQLEIENDRIANILLPAKKNVLRLLQVTTAVAIAVPEILAAQL